MIDEAALEQFNSLLNELETNINEGFKVLSETDDSDVRDYFEFYLEEIPEVFEVDNPQNLSQSEMTDCLKVHAVASHCNGEHQFFVIDYTLGYDQLLALKFDKGGIIQIAWES
ncbi:MAG: DUF2004 domain-containing protein [Erysipelothrix sp.]